MTRLSHFLFLAVADALNDLTGSAVRNNKFSRLSLAQTANAPRYPAVFAFGDSILDTGNNNFLATFTKCNFPPYGKDYYGGVATGRFGDGRVLSDLITAALGPKETLPAYLGGRIRREDYPTGVCFASGGSGNDDMTANMQGVMTLSTQLRHFEEYTVKLKQMVGAENASSIIANALYLFSSGNNDIAITYSFTLRRLQIFNVYAGTLVSAAESFLKRLYDLGARHVWALSTLPLGCLPGARTALGGPLRFCAEIVNGEASIFNGMLASGVSRLRTTLPNYDVKFIDVYTPMLNIIRNPFPSGFLNVLTGCCGTGTVEIGALCNMFTLTCPIPSTYFFWDSGHPTQRAYQLTLAAILKSQSIDITSYHIKKTLGHLPPLNSSILH